MDVVVTAAPRLLDRYQETAPGCSIDLSDNTNLWGLPPSAERAIASSSARGLSRYPSAYSAELKRTIARYVGVEDSMIVAGCGSDDILDSAMRAFTKPGETLALLDPTFSMMRIFAAVSGLNVAPIVVTDTRLANAFSETRAPLLYLCSPNNPTGSVIELDVIESIVERASGIVIIDEAYIDFGGVSAIRLLERYDNVLIARTLSKAFGLAGFRVGYGVGSPDVVCRVEAARGPYKISAISERVAIECINSDLSWVRQHVTEVIAIRQRFATELSSIGLMTLESNANFVLVPVDDAMRVETQMRVRGIAVRPFTGLTGIGDAIRITIGPWESMQLCMDALREVQR
jgi:histidinol-phosphate aminotransferase